MPLPFAPSTASISASSTFGVLPIYARFFASLRETMTLILTPTTPTDTVTIVGFALDVTSDVTTSAALGALMRAPIPTYACTVERFADTVMEAAAAPNPKDPETPTGDTPARPSAWTYTMLVTLLTFAVFVIPASAFPSKNVSATVAETPP